MSTITKGQLQKYVARTEALMADARKARGFVAVIKSLPALAHTATQIAEDAGKEIGIRGADKKELALDIIFAYVQLPWWLPERFARMLASRAIEAAVKRFSK